MGRCYEDDFICNPRCNENNFIYKPIKTKKCSKCGNLLENPSFEAGLTDWVTNNVSASGEKPFEGTAIARMGQTAPSMFQDVLLNKNCRKPLLLSFEILPSLIEFDVFVGNLIVEVLWLNDEGEIIGTGLRTLIPEERTSITQNRLTFVEITDLPPSDAAAARLQFSKGSTTDNSKNLLDIDQVILAPIDSINLVKNSGFQLALTNWNAIDTTAQFTNVYEGTGTAELDANGRVFQSIPINQLPRNSKFLLSFAVIASFDVGSIRAQVIWLDKFGSPIGTGLDLLINGGVFEDQLNYTTYVDITNEAPKNAVTAEIKFINTNALNVFQIDKVIFARVMSTNLLQNPSFENDLTLSPWIGEGANVVQSIKSYEGNRLVRIDGNGGFVSQEVPVESKQCYLLNFGYEPFSSDASGNLLAEVYWLDQNGQEIGLGLSINHKIDFETGDRLLTYLGVTEAAPDNAVRARVQFSRSVSVEAIAIDIDKVVFARLV
ncbi:hypothetical protein JOC70_001394 [Clostridium pascui]|uniref:hypothetical protein n=1 Tax=Clostridium pascui TaxID=46609 RepID=UPI00195649AA|nr:hypothetical protein [Clostridium pascui]MBM7869924.1 hypothetical protein [Clostridium pascui]